jgi:hypothetical protein
MNGGAAADSDGVSPAMKQLALEALQKTARLLDWAPSSKMTMTLRTLDLIAPFQGAVWRDFSRAFRKPQQAPDFKVNLATGGPASQRLENNLHSCA